jgi:hypothetical protein
MTRSILAVGCGLFVIGAAVATMAEEKPHIYGSEEAIRQLLPTYNLGGVPEPSGDELATMQKGQYILHARAGKLTRVPVEKVRLPYDPKGHPQVANLALDPDGTVYVNQMTLMCKSADGGRTWKSYESTMEGSPPRKFSPNNSFQILSDGTFVSAHRVADSPEVGVFASRDEGRTWEKISELPNPAGCPTRHADVLCRLSDDTLLLPIESRFEWREDPLYVFRSLDRGKTWSGPTEMNTGPGFVGGNSYETMIAPMASGRLLAVIRYHGGVVPQWPLVDPERRMWYKTVFLSDSEDGGKTWKNLRPLTNVHGQCHGHGLGLSDGSVIVSFDHRYPPGTPSGKAMVSYDEGRTWQDEVYYLYFGSYITGFSQNVELADGTILTIAAMNDHSPECPMFDYPSRRCSHCKLPGNTDVWAIRWNLEKQ